MANQLRRSASAHEAQDIVKSLRHPRTTTGAGEGISSMSLLRILATLPVANEPVHLRYDAERQVSQVLEDGRWVDSWDAMSLSGTKKMDIETGEDAKGR